MARVLAVLGGERAGARARLDVRERAHAALGLGDDLVRDGEHVGRAERRVQARAGGGEQAGEVVAGADLRQAREGVERRAPAVRPRGRGEPLEQRARARRAAARASSAARSASRSPGVSTSSSSEGACATRTVAPAACASAAWRAKEPGPKAGASTVGGAISSAFVPEPWRSGTITTPGPAVSSSAATSSASSAGQSPGTSSTRCAPARDRRADAPSGRGRLPRLLGIVHHLDGRGASAMPAVAPPPPRPRSRRRARAPTRAPPARRRPSPRPARAARRPRPPRRAAAWPCRTT